MTKPSNDNKNNHFIGKSVDWYYIQRNREIDSCNGPRFCLKRRRVVRLPLERVSHWVSVNSLRTVSIPFTIPLTHSKQLSFVQINPKPEVGIYLVNCPSDHLNNKKITPLINCWLHHLKTKSRLLGYLITLSILNLYNLEINLLA